MTSFLSASLFVLLYTHLTIGCEQCSKLIFDNSFCPRNQICTDQLVRTNGTCSSYCDDSTLWVNYGTGWRLSKMITCNIKQKKETKPIRYSCSVRETCTKCPIPSLLMSLSDDPSLFTPIDNMRLTPTGRDGLCTQLQCDSGYKMIARTDHGEEIIGMEKGMKCSRISRWTKWNGQSIPSTASIGCTRVTV